MGGASGLAKGLKTNLKVRGIFSNSFLRLESKEIHMI